MKTNHPYSLTLHFVPSPFGMNWSSPSALAKTAIKNKISMKSRFMGHVYVEIHSEDQKFLTGMSSNKMNFLPLLILKQMGFGILFHSFEGRLESLDELEIDLKDKYESGRANFIKFILSREQVDRLVQYLEAYKEVGGDKYYGLANRPLYKEGAGCSAFGASFLQVLNLMEDEFKNNWSHSVKIPTKFIGAPVTKNKINLAKIVANAKSWASDNEDFKEISYWDPDRMHAWVKKQVINFKPGDYELMPRGNSMGLIFNFSDKAVPHEPIFKN
jgi:hypothetical protein